MYHISEGASVVNVCPQHQLPEIELLHVPPLWDEVLAGRPVGDMKLEN